MGRHHIAGPRMAALAASLLATALSGCSAMLTVASMGAGVGITHTLNGIIYKTFTAPIQGVEEGSLVALHDMGISVLARETNPAGERVIAARAKDREIDILLEPLTPRTTRMRVTASNGMIKDGATATEIILQTERVLSKD